MSVRLHPILSGEIRLRVMNPRPPRRGAAKLPRTFLRSMFRQAQWYPVPVFLVEHPSEGAFLIDVGYDPSIEADPTRTLGRLFGTVVMKHRLSERNLPDRVAATGVDPSQVSRAVMTHLHLDHASGSAQWPRVTFVVDRRERAAAARRAPGPYVRTHLATIERWQEIDYAGPEAESFETFGRTVDLYGDGLVRLIASPGHAPGHQSVLLQLRDRYALLCGDSAMSTRELQERLIDGIPLDQSAYLRSGDEARAFMRAHPDTLAIPSHDRELWAQLESSYN